ncbi:GNAT family N-acetyltransferase [Desertihabitans brevis]|nr:GNAT family N-acetyltransferase [Desertihabitans brevis]
MRSRLARWRHDEHAGAPPPRTRRGRCAMTLTFEHRDAEHRFVASDDGREVGVVDYRLDGTVATITHTGTDPGRRGEGIAGRLTTVVLDDMRARGWSVVPQCPYTAQFIDQHPGYADLLA